MYKVVLLKPLHPSGVELLRKHGCAVFVSRGVTEADFIKDIQDADAIFVRNEQITPHMMDSAPKLKVIAKHGAGYDNIDVDYATKRQIRVVYVPGGNTVSVAEHVCMMMLACARRINYVQNQFRSGNYAVRFTLSDTHDLAGATLGIIGCGHIGRMVAKKARQGFDMKVIGYSRHHNETDLEEDGILYRNTMEEVLHEADYVSIHLSSTPETVGIIGEKELGMMKKSAYLINTARGNIVDEKSLIAALMNGKIMGAGLDVFADEPVKPDNPLLSMEQVIVTPHVAGMTIETSERLSRIGAMGILEVLTGNPVVTYPVN